MSVNYNAKGFVGEEEEEEEEKGSKNGKLKGIDVLNFFSTQKLK